MKKNKLFLVASVQAALFSSAVIAGDVEIHLPAASDAMTIDQPAGTELMRVHGNGNVGIGTTTPTSQLDVLGATNAYITLRDGDATKDENVHHAGMRLKDGNDNQTAFIGFNTSVEGLSIQNLNDDGSINFSTGGNANQVVIAADGDVGIGTVSPIGELHVVDSDGDDQGQLVISGGAAGNISMKSHMVDDVQLMSLGSLTVPEAINIRNNGGNVGVGAVKPDAKLHIAGGSDANLTTGSGYLQIGDASGANLIIDNNEILARNNEAVSGLYLQLEAGAKVGIGDSDISYPAKLNVDTDISEGEEFPALLVAGDSAYGDIVSPSGDSIAVGHWDVTTSTFTNRLHIAADGKVGVGIAAPTEKLHVYGGVKFEGLAAGSSGNYVCRDTNGVITHGGSCSTSDMRLKKDVKPVREALTKVVQLQGVTYKWKDEARGQRTELGLIAQDVEKVVPEVVDTANDDMGTRSIRYEDLVALLIESTKEQQAQIKAQQQRIEALEAKLK